MPNPFNNQNNGNFIPNLMNNPNYKEYIIYKDDVPRLSATALEMARTHLDLYNKWHSVVVQVINEYKSTKGEAPAEMKAIWNYEHERLTDEYNELKYKINNA